MTAMDWLEWHTPYDDEASPLSRRLPSVRSALHDALDARPAQPVRL